MNKLNEIEQETLSTLVAVLCKAKLTSFGRQKVAAILASGAMADGLVYEEVKNGPTM